MLCVQFHTTVFTIFSDQVCPISAKSTSTWLNINSVTTPIFIDADNIFCTMYLLCPVYIIHINRKSTVKIVNKKLKSHIFRSVI